MSTNEFYIVPKVSLDATADAIREKTGSQAAIEYTQDGFADAVDAIPSGGGTDYLEKRAQNLSASYENDGITSVEAYAFYKWSNASKIHLPNLVSAGSSAFYGVGVDSFHFNKLESINSSCFTLCLSLEIFVDESAITSIGTSIFQGCSALRYFDCNEISFSTSIFYNCSSLDTIIIRSSKIAPFSGTLPRAIQGTPFESGGAGGTIYIPKSLYDHLGDGTSLDYKAATNWSTIDGYGTITWAQIEGSQYENYYADGTPVPTT